MTDLSCYSELLGGPVRPYLPLTPGTGGDEVAVFVPGLTAAASVDNEPARESAERSSSWTTARTSFRNAGKEPR